MQKSVTSAFIILALSLFFGVTGNDSYNLLPKHFELIGFTSREIGFIMSFTGLGGMLVLPLLVFVIDHFRKKRILTVTMILQGLIPLFYFLTVNSNTFYAIPRLIQGGMIAVTMIGFTTALSYVASAERRSRAFALLGIMGQFGLFAGIFVGEHLYDTFGFLALYLFTLFLYLSSLTLVQFFPESTFIHNYQEPKLSDFVAVFRQKAAYPVVFWIFILGSAFGTMVSFVPKIVLSAGLDFIKPFYIAFPLTVILVRATLSHFFDRFPKHRVLFLPLVLIPVSLYTVTFVTNYAILVLAGALYGMCHGVMFPVLLAYLLDYAPVNFRGRMNIIFQLFFNLGIFLSANIGGLIAEISVELTFRSMAIFTVSGIALLVFLQMRKRKLSAGT